MLRKKFSGRLAGKVNKYGGFSRLHGDQPPPIYWKICTVHGPIPQKTAPCFEVQIHFTHTNRPRKRKLVPIWVIGSYHNRFKTKHIQNACMVLTPWKHKIHAKNPPKHPHIVVYDICYFVRYWSAILCKFGVWFWPLGNTKITPYFTTWYVLNNPRPSHYMPSFERYRRNGC